MTHNQMIQEVVNAKIRADGGPLSEVVIYWPGKDAPGSEWFDPRTAAQVVRDVRFNGGHAHIKQTINA